MTKVQKWESEMVGKLVDQMECYWAVQMAPYWAGLTDNLTVELTVQQKGQQSAMQLVKSETPMVTMRVMLRVYSLEMM